MFRGLIFLALVGYAVSQSTPSNLQDCFNQMQQFMTSMEKCKNSCVSQVCPAATVSTSTSTTPNNQNKPPGGQWNHGPMHQNQTIKACFDKCQPAGGPQMGGPGGPGGRINQACFNQTNFKNFNTCMSGCRTTVQQPSNATKQACSKFKCQCIAPCIKMANPNPNAPVPDCNNPNIGGFGGHHGGPHHGGPGGPGGFAGPRPQPSTGGFNGQSPNNNGGAPSSFSGSSNQLGGNGVGK